MQIHNKTIKMEVFMFNGKKAVVTGASRGIGFAIAKRLVEQGATVVITGRNFESLLNAQKLIGDRAIPMVWDVSDIAIANEKIEEAARLMGGLDILVNNAGVFSPRNGWNQKPIIDTTPEEWISVMRVNLDGLFFAMKAAVKYMLTNNVQGNVLNVTSVAGYEPALDAYFASKAAANALTRGWAKMYSSKKITINGIAPGPVATEMNHWHEGDPLENSSIPYGRFALCDEIAELALYMLSDKAKMLCGETIIFDGGYSIR
jgi:3-oxoacyl-[acyl-carrier protein] reductase